MKAYMMNVLVVDYQNMGYDAVKILLERCKHVYPAIISMREADIGEWSIDHPLNRPKTMYDAVKTYFPE